MNFQKVFCRSLNCYASRLIALIPNYTYVLYVIQWNLSIMDTLGPDIFDHFLLQYRVFPLLEVKNVLVTPFGTKIFVLIMEVFSIESLIQRVC